MTGRPGIVYCAHAFHGLSYGALSLTDDPNFRGGFEPLLPGCTSIPFNDLAALEQILRRYEARPWEKLAKEEARQQDRIKLFRLVAYSAEIVLVWARNERFDQVGKSWPELAKAPLCDMDLSTAESERAQEFAVQHALANRWDLMNARAQVVDAWRQLKVTANALMGVFNVQYNLQSSTPQAGSHPFAFSTDRTSQALTFNTHRIHYDRRHATHVEGYAGLVVHGPLVATLLLFRQRCGVAAGAFCPFRHRGAQKARS